MQKQSRKSRAASSAEAALLSFLFSVLFYQWLLSGYAVLVHPAVNVMLVVLHQVIAESLRQICIILPVRINAKLLRGLPSLHDAGLHKMIVQRLRIAAAGFIYIRIISCIIGGVKGCIIIGV